MISAILFFFGITLIYTGFLASGRDMATGLIIACVGLILAVKPAMEAARYFRNHFGPVFPTPKRRSSSTPGKPKPRKVHLKLVKSEDERPTIH